MRRYESYKDSGVEWLGKVPSHWEVKKMKFLFQDTSIKNKPDETLLSVTQNRGVIPRDWLEERTVMPSGSLETFKFIEKDDFAISLRSFEGGLEICHHDGIISPAYTVLKYNKKLLNNGYYKYLFKCQKFISEMQTSIVGIREGKNISYEELKYSFLPIPQTNEQQKISQFLDDKTAKIDQAVDLAEKQIALLKEHKQILIQNAVTRGLNPDVPLKDSGVEWQGDLPSHWDVQRSKFIFKKIERKVNEEDQIVTCFRDGQVTLRANRRTEGFTNALKEHGYQGIRKGDLVIHAMDAFAGAIGISDSDGKATPVYSVCLPHNKQKIDVYFYAYYLRNLALSGFISSLAKGIRERSTDFRYADFAELLLPIPPYLEQQKIADYLDKQTAKIDQAIALKTAHIEKLKEYKSVLINDMVTGKVRV